MSIESTVYQRVTADSAVSALIGNRLYPSVAPDGVQKPYGIYDLISHRRSITHGGESTLHISRVQIDVYAKTREEAIELSDAVINALHAQNWNNDTHAVYSSELDNQQTTYLADVSLHRSALDFLIHYGVM